MQKRYLINLPKTVVEDLSQQVVDFIQRYHPHYLLPGETLTEDFVELVLAVYANAADLGDMVDPSTSDTFGVVEALQDSGISPLVSCDMVRAIWETSDRLAMEDFMKNQHQELLELADMACMTELDYFRRGSVRLELRRLADAYDDLTRACVSDCVDLKWRRCRADLLLQAGMVEAAFCEISVPYELSLSNISTFNGLTTALDDLRAYIGLFKRCGQTGMMVKSALRYVALVREMVSLVQPHPDNKDDMIAYHGPCGNKGMVNINFYLGYIGETLEELACQGVDKDVCACLQTLEQCAREIEERIGVQPAAE